MSVTIKSPQVAAAQISLAATEVARSIVEHPSEVSIDVLESDQSRAVLLLRVHPEDMETLLAHEGRILRALRTFTYAVASKNNLAIQLQVEATQSPPGPSLPATLATPPSKGQAQRSDKTDESKPGI